MRPDIDIGRGGLATATPEMFRRLIMAMIGVGVWTRKHATVALDAALHPGLFTHLVTSVAAAEVLESGRS